MNENIVRVLRLAKVKAPEWQISETCVIRSVTKFQGAVRPRPFCPLEVAAGSSGWRHAGMALGLTPEETALIAYAADNEVAGMPQVIAVRTRMLEIFGLQEPPGC